MQRDTPHSQCPHCGESLRPATINFDDAVGWAVFALCAFVPAVCFAPLLVLADTLPAGLVFMILVLTIVSAVSALISVGHFRRTKRIQAVVDDGQHDDAAHEPHDGTF